MKLKEIKQGMVIHCKNDEEKKALLEEAERIGYLWSNGNKPTKSFFPSNTLVFRLDGLRKNLFWTGDQNKNIEFSDLIIPELTAEEALIIRAEICGGRSCEDCPIFQLYSGSCNKICIEHAEEVVKLLEQWKSDHEKKEPEIETVDICRIIEVLPDGRKRYVHEVDIEEHDEVDCFVPVEEILKEYCMQNEGEFIAVHEVVSRVKR